MAGPYYWVGGTGNWSDATNHWSTSSGGSPNVANIPGIADDVYFDDNSFTASDQSVTVNATANCKSMTWGYSITNWNATLKGSSALNIYGSLLFDASMAAITYSGTVTFKATATGKTINTRSHTLVWTVVFDGTGGGWTLTDNLYMETKNLTLTRGSFNTDGYSVKCLTFASSNTNTRTLTLAESIITCYDTWNLSTVTGLTFSGASSSIAIGYGDINNPDFAGGGKTYGEVICYSNRSYAVSQYVTITGSNTIATLSFPIPGTNCRLQGSTQTVTNLLIYGTAYLGVCIVNGTIVTASTITLDYCLMKTITKSGAGSITITNGQDLGGNTNVTFSSTRDFTKAYWVGGSGTWIQTGYLASDSDHWSNSSGGSGGAKKPYNDTTFYGISAIFDSNSFTSGSKTLTFSGNVSCKDFDAVNATNSPIFTGTSEITIGGYFYLPTVGCTWPANSLIFSATSGTNYIITNGISLGPVDFNGTGGTWIISGGITLTTFLITKGHVEFTAGTINCSSVSVANDAACAIDITACTVNTRTWSVGTGATVVSVNSTIICYSASTTVTFGGGGKTYHNVELRPGTTATISGNNTYNELKFAIAGKTYIGTASSIQTVTSFVAEGALGSLITIQSTSTTKWTLTKTSGTVYAIYCSIVNCWTSGGAIFNAIQSTNGGNTTGWTFVKGASGKKTPTLYLSSTYEVPVETYNIQQVTLANIVGYILAPEVLIHDPKQIKAGTENFSSGGNAGNHTANSVLTFDNNGLMLATFHGSGTRDLHLYRSLNTDYASFEDFGFPDMASLTTVGSRGVSVDENNDYVVAFSSTQAHHMSQYKNGVWSARSNILSVSYGGTASIQAGKLGVSYHGLIYFSTTYGTYSYKCVDGAFVAAKTIGSSSRSACGVYDRTNDIMYVFVASEGTTYMKVALYKSVNQGDSYTLVYSEIFPENSTDYCNVTACMDDDGGLHVVAQPGILSSGTAAMKYRYSADGGATWGPIHTFDSFNVNCVNICAYDKNNVIMMFIDETSNNAIYYRKTVIGWLDYVQTDIAPVTLTISYKKGADGYFYFGYTGDASHTGVQVNKLAFLVEYSTGSLKGNTGKVGGSSYTITDAIIPYTSGAMKGITGKMMLPLYVKGTNPPVEFTTVVMKGITGKIFIPTYMKYDQTVPYTTTVMKGITGKIYGSSYETPIRTIPYNTNSLKGIQGRLYRVTYDDVSDFCNLAIVATVLNIKNTIIEESNTNVIVSSKTCTIKTPYIQNEDDAKGFASEYYEALGKESYNISLETYWNPATELGDRITVSDPTETIVEDIVVTKQTWQWDGALSATVVGRKLFTRSG